MTRKLESLFDFPISADEPDTQLSTEQTHTAIVAIDATIDKIDAALPAVRDLDSSDQELDDIAAKATETFENLTDLGFNVDSRYAAELFAVAGTMLGHALTAKTTKLQKKLKVLDLQMKKLKLDQDAAKNKGEDLDMISGEGQVLSTLSRNELLEKLIGNRDQNNKDA
jgi:hypothetical protein